MLAFILLLSYLIKRIFILILSAHVEFLKLKFNILNMK